MKKRKSPDFRSSEVGISAYILSELIQSLLKLPNCPLKQQPHILQLSEALGLAFSVFEGFVGILLLPLILELAENTMYIAQRNNAQDWIQHSTQDLKPSANINTHYSLAKSITGCIKFTKRVEL